MSTIRNKKTETQSPYPAEVGTDGCSMPSAIGQLAYSILLSTSVRCRSMFSCLIARGLPVLGAASLPLAKNIVVQHTDGFDTRLMELAYALCLVPRCLHNEALIIQMEPLSLQMIKRCHYARRSATSSRAIGTSGSTRRLTVSSACMLARVSQPVR